MTGTDRANLLRRFADELLSRTEDIARVVTTENGMPFWQSKFANGVLPDEVYRHAANLAETMQWEEEVPAALTGDKTVIRHEPIGVVGAIVPWNGPHAIAAYKVGPALAAGNTVVLKPSPETSLDLEHYIDAAEAAGIPPGVLNIVPGGRGTGAAVVRHPGVKKIGFTGSTEAGRAIAAVCAEQLKPVTLELGGKSAAILLEDVDLDAFAAQLPSLCIPMAGQFCYANSRILAPASRYDEIVEAVATAASSIPAGDPFDDATVLSPLVAERQLHRVERYVETGRNEGADLVVGGRRPSGQKRGWYYEPTVFKNVDNRMTIAQEEIFGPVVTVIRYEDEAEAIALANDSVYGLGGSVFTADHSHGVDIARKIEAGTVGVNRYLVPANAPFGGYKASGLGRELGPQALHPYLEVKSIYV
jgi:acyl-CoA reductase-like NAD-dependent aldehyde dehydrogenase